MYKARYLDVISEIAIQPIGRRKFRFQFQITGRESIIDDEHSTRFENLIYRALSSGLITESKAAVLLNKTTEEVLHNFVLA